MVVASLVVGDRVALRREERDVHADGVSVIDPRVDDLLSLLVDLDLATLDEQAAHLVADPQVGRQEEPQLNRGAGGDAIHTVHVPSNVALSVRQAPLPYHFLLKSQGIYSHKYIKNFIKVARVRV